MNRTYLRKLMLSLALAVAGLATSLPIAAHAQKCTQDHDHDTLPWELPACPWEAYVRWCENDHGFNDGASRAVSIALQSGLKLPEQVSGAFGKAIGTVWRRYDMINFAKLVANTGNPAQGTAIVLECQAHDCHAYKCLAFHAPEVSKWLKK